MANQDIIQEIEQLLVIDKNSLDEMLIQQPELYYYAAAKHVEAVSIRDRKKLELDEAKAIGDSQVRKDLSVSGEKATEAIVANQVQLLPRVKKVSDEFIMASERMAKLFSLKEAFQQRSYVLKDLVNLYIAGYWGAGERSTARTDAVVGKVREEQATHRASRPKIG